VQLRGAGGVYLVLLLELFFLDVKVRLHRPGLGRSMTGSRKTTKAVTRTNGKLSTGKRLVKYKYYEDFP
jgi:hypothetical protein